MTNTMNKVKILTSKDLDKEALILGENILSTEQKDYLKNLNLCVGVVKSVNVENPRHQSKTTWIGMDRLLGEPEGQPAVLADDGSELRTIKALATRILASDGKDINDFYCGGVINEGHHLYTLVDMDTKLDFNVNGFIFISKEDIAQMRSNHNHAFSQDEINDLHAAKANEIFEWEIAEYKCWVHGDVYDVTVCVDYNSVVRTSRTLEHCYHIENLIELEVYSVAGSIIKDINNTDGAVKVTLKMDTDKIKDDYLGYLVAGITREFDFAFTLGSTTEDYNTGEMTVVLLPQEIPTFQDLINSSGFHLIDLMRKHSADANGNESHGAWDTVNMLMNPLPFNEWSDIMQKALLNTLFDSIHYVKVIDIEVYQ